MKLYFAPLEGITDYIYRRLHRRYFPGVDMYFTPFISPTYNHLFTPRQLRQLAPENNEDVPLTPQLLTKNAGDFLWAANALADMGYGEVNLNVGCPSGTVTAKGKGAGLLADKDSLRRLLDGIFAAPPVKISVKTRLGVREPGEFGAILDIYNDYPISELIVHVRTAKEMYAGAVHVDTFAEALISSHAPVCYNGDVTTPADIVALERRFPDLGAIMIGRGLVADPALVARRDGAELDRETLRAFNNDLWECYCAAFGGPSSAMHRMKAIWAHMIGSFQDGETYAKGLAKAKKWPDFLAMTEDIFASLPLAQPVEKSPFETQH